MASTYYAAAAGSNSNSGLSALLPWQTIAKVNAQTFSAGDSILFNRGDTWRETLTVPLSGLFFDAYGSGALPILDGGTVGSGWTSASVGGEDFTDGTGAKPEGWWMLTEASGTRADGNTTNNNALSENGGTISRVTGPNANVPYAAHLTRASSQYLSRADASLSASFPGKSGTSDNDTTFGCWMRSTNAAGGGGLIGKGDAYSLSEYNNARPDHLLFSSSTDADAGKYDYKYSALAQNAWHHVVGTWKQSTGVRTMYIDGVAVTPDAADSANATMYQNTTAFTIGHDIPWLTNPYFDGDIGEPFVFNSLITPTQIASIYANGLTGGTSFTTYWVSCSTDPKDVWEDGVRLVGVATQLLMTAGTFFFDSGASRLYIRTYEDATPTGHVIEYGTRTNAIAATGKTSTSISNIMVRLATDSGISFLDDCSGLSINGVVAEKNYGDGLFWFDASHAVTGITIANSTFRYNGASGAVLTSNGTSWGGLSATNNDFYNNCQRYTDSFGTVITSGSDAHTYMAGFYIYSVSHTGGAGTISGNRSYDNGVNGGRAWQYAANQGVGIWLDTAAGTLCTGNTVYGNVTSGIFVEKTHTCVVTRNVIYGNGSGSIANADDTYSMGSLQVVSGGSQTSDGNTIAHNSVYGGWCGITCRNDNSDSSVIQNNLFKNNIAIGATRANLWCTRGGDNQTYGSGNVYTYNCFGADAASLLYWHSALVTTYSAWQSATGAGAGITDHCVNADPLFTNAGANDFTLQSGSPCIAAGIYIAGISTANPPDLGAFQTSSVTPSGVAASGAVNVPTVLPSLSVAAPSIAATGAVHAPTVLPSLSIAAPFVAATGAVHAPSTRGDCTVTPAAVAGTGAVNAPSVSANGSASVTPSPASASGAVNAPSVRGDVTIVLAGVAATAAVNAVSAFVGARVPGYILGTLTIGPMITAALDLDT